jgi:predicted nucleic acid-binding protein
MILVYSLLQGHPALPACEQLLRAHTDWFTSPWILFEAKAVLTKVYGEDAARATQKLAQVAAGPVTLLNFDPADVPAIFQLADTHAVDFTDAVLLHLASKCGAGSLATDDQHLAAVCSRFGIVAVSPVDGALRKAIVAWETTNLPAKGLPRVLKHIGDWLGQVDPATAQLFWSRTGKGSHLP